MPLPPTGEMTCAASPIEQARLGPPVDGRDPHRQQRELVDLGEPVEPVAQPRRRPPDRRDDRRDAAGPYVGQRAGGDS